MTDPHSKTRLRLIQTVLNDVPSVSNYHLLKKQKMNDIVLLNELNKLKIKPYEQVTILILKH